MTLSQFLRDYLYIALGGNRKGRYRRYVNLFLTMLLGGLWHGAGWPFVVWGALHGGYLMINHGWRHLLARCGWDFSDRITYRAFAWSVKFIAVVFSWVYFRAPTLEQGNQIALAMLGFSGFEFPAGILARLGEAGAHLSAMGIVPVHGGGAAIVANYSWIGHSGRRSGNPTRTRQQTLGSQRVSSDSQHLASTTPAIAGSFCGTTSSRCFRWMR